MIMQEGDIAPSEAPYAGAAPRVPALLAILDGVGLQPDGPHNAVSQADAPYLHLLFSDTAWPCRPLTASGRAVGLPDGQMGNSEVGHLNIGAGRVIYQDLTRIDLAIEDGSLGQNQVLVQALGDCARRSGRLHLMGLLSDGGVHSSEQHMQALLAMAVGLGVKDIALHAFLDGRDVAPDSGEGYVMKADAVLRGIEAENRGVKARFASISGRYYAMDRDERWERVEAAWQAIVNPLESDRLAKGYSAEELVSEAYSHGVFDEFLEPYALDSRGVVDGDTVVFFNFRPDRARQLTRAFIDPGFDGFDRIVVPEVDFVCLTEYDPRFAELGAHVAFAKQTASNVLADHLASLGLRQLHIAETEKYAHVTFFFNGGVEAPKPGEQRILVPSPKVATYDLKPEMSAYEVTEALVEAISAGDAEVFVLNYANGDMVGHTGDLEATKLAVAAVDRCLEQVVSAVLEAGGVALVTADHGNAEVMADEDGHPWTAHTLSPVPLVLLCPESHADTRSIDLDRASPASLADIAPTLLDLMGLPAPPEFEGRSLLVRKG